MDLHLLFRAFIVEAVRLRAAYAHKIDILIGFETEWLSSPAQKTLLKGLTTEGFSTLSPRKSLDDTASPPTITSESTTANYDAAVKLLGKPDLFVGSVHHVHDIPIDFDKRTYERAKQALPAGDRSNESLHVAYYEHMLAMVEALAPPVIGHFDLPRLFSEPSSSGTSAASPPTFQSLHPLSTSARLRTIITRVLHAARTQQPPAVLEVNTSALRKNLAEPYPCAEILRAWLAMGGDVCLSDDSHGVEQLGACYAQALDWMEWCGVRELVVFKHAPGSGKNGLLLERKRAGDSQEVYPGVVRAGVGLETVRGWFEGR